MSVCTACGESGHRTIRSGRCLLNPSRGVCTACGESGHRTIRSGRCLLNPSRKPAIMNQVYTEERVDGPDIWDGRHDLGRMNILCRYCHSRMWVEEKSEGTNNNPSFRMCCNHGSVSLNPVQPLPPLLEQLTTHQHPDSALFLKHIRAYNSNLSFTSVGAKVEERGGGGPPCYIISGQLCHRMGSLLSTPNHQARFAQIYLYDGEEQEVLRTALLLRTIGRRNERLTIRLRGLMVQLQEIILNVNCYARFFRNAQQILQEHPSIDLELRMTSARDTQHRGRFNLPIGDELAVVLPGHGEPGEPHERDIVVRKADGGLRRVHMLHPSYDALQYPLLFPYGEDGWHINIPLRVIVQPEEHEMDTPNHRRRKMVTLMQYLSYRLMVRENTHIHRFQRLFLQYCVDSYARLEGQRLSYIRTHQRELRVESYRGVNDALDINGTISYTEVGRRIILPSTFQGSPRHMHQQYQDAMAIVRHYRKPDLFITMTCNPNWEEIQRELLPGQAAADRPDIVVRVFNMKVKTLLDDLLKKNVMGKVVAHVYVVEFQKRGLPHVHILLILHDNDKPISTEDYDKFVWAEIPNRTLYPRLFQTITTCMIHTCTSNCTEGHRQCSKGFPKPYQDQTQSNDDGYPLYRRRNNGEVIERNGALYTNQHVVPYNPFLAQKYNCHINVEICSSIQSVKYLFKYVHKGHDMINASINNDNIVDEISNFVESRYISQCEAVYRIFRFSLHGRVPAIVRLAVHEDGWQNVILTEETDLSRINERETTLTAYFKLNQSDEEARHMYYHDIPTKYVFEEGVWRPRQRQRQAPTIGRMYFVAPSDRERFCLRLLLTHVKGATGFLMRFLILSNLDTSPNVRLYIEYSDFRYMDESQL